MEWAPIVDDHNAIIGMVPPADFDENSDKLLEWSIPLRGTRKIEVSKQAEEC